MFLCMKKTQDPWTFELPTGSGIVVHIYNLVGFEQKIRLNDQTLNLDTFFRPPISSGQFIIRTEKYTDAGIYLIYGDHNSSQC